VERQLVAEFGDRYVIQMQAALVAVRVV
jgi:hypothetical protein